VWAFYSHVMNDELIQKALVKFQRGEVPGDVAAVFDRETGIPTSMVVSGDLSLRTENESSTLKQNWPEATAAVPAELST
jgi:hypothetical protein